MNEAVKIEKIERIKIFDSVRAGATIAVFIFHAGYLFSYSGSSIIDWHRLVYFSGTVGVSVFFVLSGFLLFYQMYKKNEALNFTRLSDYIKKRCLRILPLYYFSLFFILFVFRHDILLGENSLRTIMFNLLFLRDFYRSGPSISINPVYWTLIIEMHFYVLLPFFYYLFHRYKKISLFFVLILLGIAYRTSIVILMADPGVPFLLLTPANFDFFAFGMFGGYLYVERGRLVGYIGKNLSQVILLSIFTLFVYFYDLSYFSKIPYVFAPTLFGLIIMLCILSFLINEKSLLGRLFTSKPVLFIAKISYSIYIWHAIVIGKIENLLISNNEKLVLNIIVTFAVSTVSYYLVEAPFIKLKVGGSTGLLARIGEIIKYKIFAKT